MRDDIGVAFGARLKHLRQHREFSQLELAITADLDRSYISQLEGGRLLPSLTTLVKLAASLNVSIGELVDFKLESRDEKPTQSRSTKKPSVDEVFGDVLVQLRKATGLSQQQLAAAAGIDRSFISRLERGLVSFSVTTIFKLAKPLNVNPSDIIKAFEKSMR